MTEQTASAAQVCNFF